MRLITTGFYSLVTAGSICSCTGPAAEKPASQKYNVLIFTVDDMRDYAGFLNGYAGKVYTPNMDRLAAQGVAFTNAHVAATVSCPSRNAFMTGLRPSTSGLYNNGQWWKAALPDVVTMPQYFKNNGYYSAGAGKVFHHTPGNNPPCSWDEFQDQVFDDPWYFQDWSPEKYWLDFGYRDPKVPMPEWKPLNGIPKLGNNDWGPIPGKEEKDYGDVQVVNYTREFLIRDHEKPFFLVVGTYRPHVPLHVPQKYFDMYPLDSIVLPQIKEDDLDDVPEEGRRLAMDGNSAFVKIKEYGKYKEALQAYLASITFADAQLGAVLDLLEKSKYADNTIVVLWSDHGWHHGTKQHWAKQTLWEECTRIPFVIKIPGAKYPDNICTRPVDVVNVFPTLVSLCGLPSMEGLDGHDMTPLLENPQAEWKYPAITEIKVGNVAVRSENWRYIRYFDGTEELYDKTNDPNDWYNLAEDEKYWDIIDSHKKWVPDSFAKPVPSKEKFYFDPGTYTYMDRKTGVTIDGRK
jgi:arylsulfatase A-like enzyme